MDCNRERTLDAGDIISAYKTCEMGYDHAMVRLMRLGYTEVQADDLLVTVVKKPTT